ncbi:flagellar basal body rod protein FlgB [Methylocaldum sp.]|uniref:flagellar basal body rod protein FlgB n=1 Tax=Methylocaldum sp. TaxID=1969727 RepID=UPI002D5D7797|nr:flagellar basal body rod protein FlgB [Methylocaldum sp.]HYE33919.1 flagellar basal body rod protein FlgB [Methylocaldum sp.]
MTINFDNALGIHPLALKLRDQRTELLASNLANADTPNYKARDLDFRSVLKSVAPSPVNLAATQAGHLTATPFGSRGETSYRVPSQPSLDGNTVETEQEQMRFAENAVQYQATLNFLSGKISSLRIALTGE